MRNQRKDLSQELEKLQSQKFDVIIIGGGATGLGCALDATLRGYKTLLLEKDDFASGTSSKSTKLIHGGVRYLEQFDFPLVTEALKERGLLMQNAQGIVHPLEFIIPAYSFYEKPYYFAGLKLYDLLAGRKGIGSTQMLSRKRVSEFIPNIRTQGLKGGVKYYDGQFDDALLAMSMVKSTIKEGGICANYCEVTGISKNGDGRIQGVQVSDKIGKKQLSFKGKVVINAAGIFTNNIFTKDKGSDVVRLMTSRGSHIVVDQEKVSKKVAMLIPKTSDDRVVFAVPWYDKVIIGTTDIEDLTVTNQPKIRQEEVDFILDTINCFMHTKLDYKDIRSTFCGLRPLVKPKKGETSSEVSRKHKIEESESGMISILGGKWTTYRAMAEDTVDFAMKKAGLPKAKSSTAKYKLRDPNEGFPFSWDVYSGKEYLKEVIESQMATSLEDVLSRRTRLTLLDVDRSKKVAEKIASNCSKLGVNFDCDLNAYDQFCDAFEFDQA